MFTLFYCDILNCVAKLNLSHLYFLQFVMEIFTLFHIVVTSNFTQISRLNFDYCWCFDLFYYPTFLKIQNICMDLRERWMQLKITKFFQTHYKNGWRRRTTLKKIFFCSNEKVSCMYKYRIAACPQMSYDLVFQSKQGTLFSCYI